MITKRQLLGGAALAASSAIPSLSPVKAAAPHRPGFLAAKDIAEAGFIFGLPIVMNYGVMYEYAVDRSSGQFKAPFNKFLSRTDMRAVRCNRVPIAAQTQTSSSPVDDEPQYD
jgi:hypothetical protein